MNRRDFFKMAGVGLAGIFSGALGHKMIGDFPMTDRLGDLMLEIQDPNLSAGRQIEIVRLLNEFSARDEIYKSWLSSQGSDPNFKNIYGETGSFRYPPLGVGVRAALTIPDSVPDSTNYTLDFDSIYYDEAKFWDPANPHLFTVPVTGKYQVYGRCVWNPSPATGRRSMALVALRNGVILAAVQDVRASTLGAVTSVYDEMNVSLGDQFYVYVDQFTGSPLNILSCTLTLRLLRQKDDE